MKTTTPKMQFTSDSTLSGLLEVIIAKSQGSSSFRKSGIELLRDQLGETSEMRNHRLKNTSDRDIEEWITILNRTTEMLEEELENRMVNFLRGGCRPPAGRFSWKFPRSLPVLFL